MTGKKLPDFVADTGYLAAGEHDLTWSQVHELLGWNQHRRNQLERLADVLDVLRRAGARRVWLNGSFATAKEQPGDFDLLFDAHGLKPKDLPAVFRRSGKASELGGDVLAIDPESLSGIAMRERTFGTDRNGIAKGIIRIDLGSLPERKEMT